MRHGELAVNDLVGLLGPAQPAVSKHLRVLRDAGLVTTRIDGPRRIYGVDVAPLRDLDAWLAPYRQTWNSALDKLERHLEGVRHDR